MGKRLFSCVAFIDLKKVFDTVDHILLPEPEHYGFCGVTSWWLTSYLQGGQTQTTSRISSNIDVQCVLCQGSVLGSLLLLLYVNDLQISSDKFNFYHFGDDANILNANKNL